MKNFLTLIGSPRNKSTSAALAARISGALEERGWQNETIRLGPALRQPALWQQLVNNYSRADALLLAAPLYVDALPAEVVLAMEQLIVLPAPPQPRRLLALVQSGFIHSHQNDAALNVCRLFARDAGMQWIGGLPLGGGGMFGSKTLEEFGKMAAPVLQAFKLAVAAIDEDHPLPEEAITLLRPPLISPHLYCFMANIGMLTALLKNHKLLKANARVAGGEWGVESDNR